MVLRLYYTTAFMSVSVGLTSVRVQITTLLPELTRDYNERSLSLRLGKLAGESWVNGLIHVCSPQSTCEGVQKAADNTASIHCHRHCYGNRNLLLQLILIIIIIITIIFIIFIIEGSLEVKLPTIWTDEKQSREEAERRERLEERRSEEKE